MHNCAGKVYCFLLDCTFEFLFQCATDTHTDEHVHTRMLQVFHELERNTMASGADVFDWFSNHTQCIPTMMEDMRY